jgi:hypothetical protein
MKKIVFTTVCNTWGGSEELWYNSATETLERGCFVGIMIYNHQFSDKQLDVFKKYKNIKFFVKKKNNIFHRNINKFLPSKYRYNTISAIVKWKPDLVVISRGYNQGSEDIMSFWLITFLYKYVTRS